MEIVLNGQKKEMEHSTLMDLIVKKGLDSEALIIEYNFEIAPQKNWEKIHLKDGDNVELLSFVGGG